jgi:ATP-dependent RNA helicase RhlE
MDTFDQLKLSKQLRNAIDELGFTKPTPIQKASFSVIKSGKNMVGIAQTGTGKTLAYMMPIMDSLEFMKIMTPRVLVLVPTRELVVQVVEHTNQIKGNKSVRVLGVYGGTNINTQKDKIFEGVDILVATPGRLYDLAVTGVLRLKDIKKLVIDEVDVMLDMGFLRQVTDIFELLPKRRQNIMLSATMTEEVEILINEYFVDPVKINIAVSGTPLENIEQTCYGVQNYYTKVNLLSHLLYNTEELKKVLIFVDSKKIADRLFENLEEDYGFEMGIIHSNKSQNFRLRSVEEFDSGEKRILIATDIMSRGLDIDKITHVISFDVPYFPENYMHRIGRTGRAEEKGKSILFFTEKEREAKEGVERLMDMKIEQLPFPVEVDKVSKLAPEEKPNRGGTTLHARNLKKSQRGASFHEKKDKNKKTNQGGSYLRKGKQYKKPKTKGDKGANLRRKKK